MLNSPIHNYKDFSFQAPHSNSNSFPLFYSSYLPFLSSFSMQRKRRRSIMELDLNLGDSSRPFQFTEKSHEASNQFGLGFNTTNLSIGPAITKPSNQHQQEQEEAKEKHTHNGHLEEDHEATNEYHISPHHIANNNTSLLKLDLLPHTPFVAPIINPLLLQSYPWHPPFVSAGRSCSRGLDVNRLPPSVVAVAVDDEVEEVVALSSSSPNSAASSFQMDLCIYSRGASDEDESGGSTRKKLRLSKEQSNFLEESFKEHNTINPKQKLALAKQLHLRPRQVEVWFQNRRARTKLKQTEVECEYLKRCCETLTEENRRLHKELQELRALKTFNTFSMQLPATTLTMCPSCERVATNSNSTTPSPATTNINNLQIPTWQTKVLSISSCQSTASWILI